VPILDQYARQAFNIPWEDGMLPGAIRRVRAVAAFGPNPVTLAALADWLRDDPGVTGGMPLSRVRLLDILAWGLIRQRGGPVE
jgi:hypothetical protein